ncbi:hypothetical protein TNCV_147191 [Trichonephila clavipes]|nr:hypothetical protein TNCV_147191 [Trichonephila clavipes]
MRQVSLTTLVVASSGSDDLLLLFLRVDGIMTKQKVELYLVQSRSLMKWRLSEGQNPRPMYPKPSNMTTRQT